MDSFPRNLVFLMERRPDDTVGSLAAKIGMDRSVLTRLRSGQRKPNAKHLVAIAKYFGLSPEDFSLPHEAFVALCDGKVPDEQNFFHSFRPISNSLERLDEVFETYQGQFIVYTKCGNEKECIASLLEFGRKTRTGIETSLINPYREAHSSGGAYIYSGQMFPVGSYLYCFLQQTEKDYEILMVVLRQSDAPKPVSLKGVWTGIGVQAGSSFVASVPALAIRQDRRISSWQREIGGKLGYLSQGKIPAIAQNNDNLSTEIVLV